MRCESCDKKIGNDYDPSADDVTLCKSCHDDLRIDELKTENKRLVEALEALHVDIKESYKWGKLAEIHHYDNLMIKMDKTIQQSLPQRKEKPEYTIPIVNGKLQLDQARSSAEGKEEG